MKKLTLLTTTLATTMIFTATTAQAGQWKRNKTVVGPHGGVWSKSAKGDCYDGACTSNQKWTGPNGRSVSRKGSGSCYDGVCEGKATWTGPNGKSVEIKRRVRRY